MCPNQHRPPNNQARLKIPRTPLKNLSRALYSHPKKKEAVLYFLRAPLDTKSLGCAHETENAQAATGKTHKRRVDPRGRHHTHTRAGARNTPSGKVFPISNPPPLWRYIYIYEKSPGSENLPPPFLSSSWKHMACLLARHICNEPVLHNTTFVSRAA